MQEWNPEIPHGWKECWSIKSGLPVEISHPKEIDIGDEILVSGKLGTIIGVTLTYDTFVSPENRFKPLRYSFHRPSTVNGKQRHGVRVGLWRLDDSETMYFYEFRSLRTARVHFKRYAWNSCEHYKGIA